MKKATSVSIAMLSLLFTSSQTLKNYVQGNPNDPNYDYLKGFALLKNYIDYDSYLNFKFGIGTTVNDYLYLF